MSTGSYRFGLGDFGCVSLSDGSVDYPLKNFFANVPVERVEEALRQRDLPLDYVTTPYTYLFVDTGEHQVLVDMGAGRLTPRTGRLLQSMRGAGIDPAEIDTVMITHAHPDHVGGTLDDDGKPMYANAHYYIWKDEWEFWFSELATVKTPEMFVTCARTNLEPLQDRVTLLDGESQVVHLDTRPATWWCRFPPATSGCCTSVIRCSIPFTWSTRTGSRSMISSPRRLPPASAGSLTWQRRRRPW
jgi:hypothetical protein